MYSPTTLKAILIIKTVIKMSGLCTIKLFGLGLPKSSGGTQNSTHLEAFV